MKEEERVKWCSLSKQLYTIGLGFSSCLLHQAFYQNNTLCVCVNSLIWEAASIFVIVVIYSILFSSHPTFSVSPLYLSTLLYVTYLIALFSLLYSSCLYRKTLSNWSSPVVSSAAMPHPSSQSRKQPTNIATTWRNYETGLSSPPVSPSVSWSYEPDSYLHLLQRAYISLVQHCKGKLHQKKKSGLLVYDINRCGVW